MNELTARRDDYDAATRGFLAAMPAFALLGLDLRALGPGTSEVILPVVHAVTFDGQHVQGGIVGALLDIAGGAAALTLVPADHGIATLGFETHHLAPAGGSELVARGQVIKPGRNQALSRVDIHAFDGDRQVLCATGFVTTRWIRIPA